MARVSGFLCSPLKRRVISSIDTVFSYLLFWPIKETLKLCLKTPSFPYLVSCILTPENKVLSLKLMKPPKCLALANDSCCKFSCILPLQNLACSVVLYLFGEAIMPWFVPVKSLAYVVTKTTVHISVLKY